MVQETLNFELAVRAQRKNAMFERLDDLLDGDQVLVTFHLLVLGRNNDTVGALTDGINDLIALVNFKLRIDDHVTVS